MAEFKIEHWSYSDEAFTDADHTIDHVDDLKNLNAQASWEKLDLYNSTQEILDEISTGLTADTTNNDLWKLVKDYYKEKTTETTNWVIYKVKDKEIRIEWKDFITPFVTSKLGELEVKAEETVQTKRTETLLADDTYKTELAAYQEEEAYTSLATDAEREKAVADFQEKKLKEKYSSEPDFDLGSVKREKSDWAAVVAVEEAPAPGSFSDARDKLMSGSTVTMWNLLTGFTNSVVAFAGMYASMSGNVALNHTIKKYELIAKKEFASRFKAEIDPQEIANLETEVAQLEIDKETWKKEKEQEKLTASLTPPEDAA